jgi:hypothetical protein
MGDVIAVSSESPWELTNGLKSMAELVCKQLYLPLNVLSQLKSSIPTPQGFIYICSLFHNVFQHHALHLAHA